MKKANMLLSDIFWFLLFVIAAFIMFMILNNVSSKVSNRLNPTDLQEIDADYMATTLPRMEAGAGHSFADVIRVLIIQKHAGPADLKKTGPYMVYKNFLDKTFAATTPMFWQKPASEALRPIGYAVVLREGDTYVDESCVQYPADGIICGSLTGQKHQDSETGLMVPSITAMQVPTRAGGTKVIPEMADIGTSYIPTAQGTVMLQVIILYGAS